MVPRRVSLGAGETTETLRSGCPLVAGAMDAPLARGAAALPRPGPDLPDLPDLPDFFQNRLWL